MRTRGEVADSTLRAAGTGVTSAVREREVSVLIVARVAAANAVGIAAAAFLGDDLVAGVGPAVGARGCFVAAVFLSDLGNEAPFDATGAGVMLLSLGASLSVIRLTPAVNLSISASPAAGVLFEISLLGTLTKAIVDGAISAITDVSLEP